MYTLTLLTTLLIIPFISAQADHHLHHGYGVCDVRLPKSCPGYHSCDAAFPTYSHGNHVQWPQFNVLSFGSINANGGHIAGRIAASLDININGGFLIGDQVYDSGHGQHNYSFIAGRNAYWQQGTLLPSTESAFVGSNFTAPQYLYNRLGATCSQPGCLNDDFTYAWIYYRMLSAMFASLPTNVIVTYQYGGVYMSCGSQFVDGPDYVAEVDAGQLSASNWYSVDSSCATGATWVINIIGENSVLFQGGSFPGVPERVLYNINGSDSVTVSTGVTGSILAPYSTYYQNNGNTEGLVIMMNVNMISTANNPSCNQTYYSDDDDSDDNNIINILTPEKSSAMMICSSLLLSIALCFA